MSELISSAQRISKLVDEVEVEVDKLIAIIKIQSESRRYSHLAWDGKIDKEDK